MQTKYKIGIIGAGAVGTALSYGLNPISYCSLFSSKGMFDVDEFRYLTIEGKKEKIISHSFPIEEMDCIFVCTKIYNIKEAIEKYINVIPNRCPIIFVCNGFILDIIEELRIKYPIKIFRISYIDIGISSNVMNEYILNSTSSKMIWGPADTQDKFYNYKSSFENILDELHSPKLGLKFIYSNNAIDYNHEKWIFNTTLNPFCVYKKCLTNKEVLNHLDLFKKTYDEVYKLSVELFKKRLDKDMIFNELLSLVERTSMNRNSMVSDVLQNKKTENDFLSGMSKNSDNYPILKKINAFIQSIGI